jgi:type III restriction enzyme
MECRCRSVVALGAPAPGIPSLARTGSVVPTPSRDEAAIGARRLGKERIRSFREEIGESYFDYLAGLDDLVLIMDESHRYRASAGIRAINELKPVLGLELTATPFVESGRGTAPFKNVIFNYPLGRAMADGFVKEPAVVTRKNFNPAGMSGEEIQQLKLEDGVRLHESVKVELETYARETTNPIVKPFLLVIARDTTHASQLMQLIQSDSFFEGRYAAKVIQVDSSKTGAEEDEMVERLLKVEHTDEPTEIVIHVNILKEGWDVSNLYTIVPLRAANARTLIEQSIGRGLRLPYGKRTGVTAVDRLNIIAHDRFQEIVEEANKPNSTIRLQQVVMTPDQLQQKTVTVVSQSQLATKLGLQPDHTTASTHIVKGTGAPVFKTVEEQKVAQIAYEVIRKLENQPEKLPSVTYLQQPDIQAAVLQEVTSQYKPAQMELEGITERPDLAAVVAKTTEIVVQQTVDIPRILVVPKGEVRSGYKPFTLDLATLSYQAPSEELWIQHLRTNQLEVVGPGRGGIEESRLEDYIVSGLVDFDDIAYDDHAELLYDLAGQVVAHLGRYLADDDVRRVLRLHQREIARFVHAQMQYHYWEDVIEYEVKISKGFTELKPSAYTTAATESPFDFRVSPADKSNMGKYLFSGFHLYSVQKFQSDAERKLAVILERESLKWFKPAKGQFQIYYKWGADHPEYQPDFVAEVSDRIFMLEPKAANQMTDAEVLAKRDVAVRWCAQASEHAKGHRGKPWQYALIPHDAIADNMTLGGLAGRFAVS